MTELFFAQISDIHISSLGDHHDMLSGHSADFLNQILAELGSIEDLDFVLFTGDLFDTADHGEFQRFHEAIERFSKPYYVIPGNHDRRPIDRTEGLTRRHFAQHFNPQVAARPISGDAQLGYWSRALSPRVRLIGLDSVKDADWGGLVDAIQLDWLKSELDQSEEQLVIVAIHHPLHPLAPIDADPNWRNFVCDNGAEVLAVLDACPQVKLVLTGHHHLTKVDWLGSRLHLACPSLAIYPCAYRTFRLSRQSLGEPEWQLAWQSHDATDGATIALAREVMARTWQGHGFAADFVEELASIALGSEFDRNGTAVL
jgi:3',5'-cyclic AMP phosphodiesterase CpdA